jgi:hypothetical protein
MILIKNVYAFILYVSDSGLQCNKLNSYWYRVPYQDRQTALGSWSVPWPLGSLYILILPSISVTIHLTMTLGQSVYPDIALHISNYTPHQKLRNTYIILLIFFVLKLNLLFFCYHIILSAILKSTGKFSPSDLIFFMYEKQVLLCNPSDFALQVSCN